MRLSIFLACLFSLAIHTLKAQKPSENLVPNPSFEEIQDCDLYFEEFDKVKDWKGYSFTPDIFHICSEISFLSVPRNIFDFQFPAHGRGYAGIMAYHVEYPNEVIGAKLKQPLEAGKAYKLTFQVSRAKTHARYASDNIGMLLTNEPDKAAYAGKAHLIMEEVITESEDWVTVSGVVRADKAYQYVMLGNFFTADYTRLQLMPEGKFETAYYFIDDVGVYPTTDLPTIVRIPQRIVVTQKGQASVQEKDTLNTTPHEAGNMSYAISGKVLDAITQEPIVSRIELTVPQTITKEYLETHYVDGTYAFTGIKNPNRFVLKVTARNYYPQSHVISVSPDEPRAKKNIYLYPFKAGRNVYLKHVDFENETAQLIPEGIDELQRLAQVMRDNPLMEIELQAITGIDSPEALQLAQKRAKAVQDYLAIAGKIDRRRLKMAYLHETAQNQQTGNASEELRKAERIEFKVLN